MCRCYIFTCNNQHWRDHVVYLILFHPDLKSAVDDRTLVDSIQKHYEIDQFIIQ